MDPNLDPELALALRVSMEEERARQEAAAKKAADGASKQEKEEGQPSGTQDATMTEQANVATSEAENKTTDLTVGFCLCFQLFKFPPFTHACCAEHSFIKTYFFVLFVFLCFFHLS